MPPEEKDEIERLKHKLYARGNKDKPLADIRTPLNPSSAEAPVAWAKEEEEKAPEAPLAGHAKRAPLYMEPDKKGMSLAAKFLFGSVGFFVLAAAAAAYMFFGGGNLISPQNIDIQVIAPSLIDSAKAQTFKILIPNPKPT